MCEISIIMTVFNAEKYLEKAISSVLAQTFTNFELILVDDGSTDASAEICDRYSEKDGRIKVIHKANGGVSSARNTGLENAKGEYIGFVDSDDYIESDMYEFLYNNLQKEDADLSICGIYDVYEGKEPQAKAPGYYLLNRNETVKMVLEAKLISVHPVNKLYKRKVFDNVRYPEGKITEDGAVMFHLLENVETVVADLEPKYYYYHRSNSITTSPFAEKDLDTIEAWKQNEEYIQKSYPEYKEIAHTRVCWAHFIVLDKILISGTEKQHKAVTKQIVRFLRKNYLFIVRDPYFTRNRKIAATVLRLNVSLYKKLAILEDEKYKSKNS
ncbi:MULTISPECIES: glycosyltransferase family 2 protein [unclassified Enterococcus]|jgi:glycosyltransferase involved in cell wall biosynthesis|uniref:glycosyltransferase family 2 protein n=1 Tax=unclassified Enterococcus TaxID=2608891 RepID=UPI003D270C56